MLESIIAWQEDRDRAGQLLAGGTGHRAGLSEAADTTTAHRATSLNIAVVWTDHAVAVAVSAAVAATLCVCVVAAMSVHPVQAEPTRRRERASEGLTKEGSYASARVVFFFNIRMARGEQNPLFSWTHLDNLNSLRYKFGI